MRKGREGSMGSLPFTPAGRKAILTTGPKGLGPLYPTASIAMCSEATGWKEKGVEGLLLWPRTQRAPDSGCTAREVEKDICPSSQLVSRWPYAAQPQMWLTSWALSLPKTFLTLVFLEWTLSLGWLSMMGPKCRISTKILEDKMIKS